MFNDNITKGQAAALRNYFAAVQESNRAHQHAKDCGASAGRGERLGTATKSVDAAVDEVVAAFEEGK